MASESTPVNASKPFCPASLIIETAARWLLLSEPSALVSSATATTATKSRLVFKSAINESVGEISAVRNSKSGEPSSSANAGRANFLPPDAMA